MTSHTPETLSAYLQQMETLLNLPLPPERHDAVLLQLQRIAEMAQPLMDYPLEMQEEIAGVYQL